ncbi:DivIVA domain-containing protein [bacterium]|nr:MAG: DivIVA domain-containing protein [bacterium]
MRIRASTIHEQTFSVSFRGFDPKEVDDFLEKVAQEIEHLNTEKEALETTLAKEKEDRLKLEEALSASRDLQKTIMDHSRREARVIEERARLEADRLISEARRVVEAYIRDIELLREKRISFLSGMAGMAEALREWMERQPSEPGPSTEEIERSAKMKELPEIPSEPPLVLPEEEYFPPPEPPRKSVEPFELEPAQSVYSQEAEEPESGFTVPEEPLMEPAPISSKEPSPKQSTTLFSLVEK